MNKHQYQCNNPHIAFNYINKTIIHICQTAFNGLKQGVDALEHGFTDAGNFVIDTAGLIGSGITDVGHTITDTATDVGHAVEHIGSEIGHAIGSKQS